MASAIKYITTGAFRLQADAGFRELPQVTTGNDLLDKPSFKGAIGAKKNLR